MNPKCLGRNFPDTFDARSADSTGLFSMLITRAVSIGRIAFDPCQRGPHLRISELAGIGQEVTERFCNRAIALSIPRQEPEFGTAAEVLILRSDHRSVSMILAQQTMRRQFQ